MFVLALFVLIFGGAFVFVAGAIVIGLVGTYVLTIVTAIRFILKPILKW